MIRKIILPILIIFPTACERDNGLASYPENSILFEDMADRYFSLDKNIFRPALDVSRGDHVKKANWALETLEDFQNELRQKFSRKSFNRDDQIDLVLLDNIMAEMEFRLKARIETSAEIATLLPGADLDIHLPYLRSLVSINNLEAGAAAIQNAISAFENSSTLPSNLSLSITKNVSSRAKNLSKRLDQWVKRAENRFPGKTDALKMQAETLKKNYKDYAENIDKNVISDLKERNAAYGAPIGREEFISRIRSRHMIQLSPEELRDFGYEQLALIQSRIDSSAKVINPDKDSRAVWEDLKLEHPTQDELPQFAFDEMIKSRDLILDKGFVTIPENARESEMLVVEGFTYKTYPFGGYGGQELRGNKIVGRFMTSPPNIDESEEGAEMRLRGNNYYWARVVAVHEIYPGHHLQGVHRREIDRPVRRNYHTTTLSEGWGLYSEALMHRHGFFPDAKTEMAMYIMQKWRAARIVVDVNLHLGWMSFDDAVDFIVDQVWMDRENALAEVRRYMGNATRPLSYLYGFRQLESLYADAQAKAGSNFDEREFHDTVLGYGSIPVPMIRAKMLGGEIPGYKIVKDRYGIK